MSAIRLGNLLLVNQRQRVMRGYQRTRYRQVFAFRHSSVVRVSEDTGIMCLMNPGILRRKPNRLDNLNLCSISLLPEYSDVRRLRSDAVHLVPSTSHAPCCGCLAAKAA
jgi:hypothetical protein